MFNKMKSAIAVCIFSIGNILLLSAQQFHNLDFEQACDTSQIGLCYWDLSRGGKNACVAEKYERGQCLVITGKKEESVGFAEQTVSVMDTHLLHIIQPSG